MKAESTILLVLAAWLAGCGGPTANDAQVTQIMQEARSDLAADPGEVPQRTLNLTQGAQLAVGQRGEPGDRRNDMDPLLDAQGGSAQPSGVELEAVALAQDGALAMARGDEADGEAKLEASIALYPTLDALQAMGPRLVARNELDRVDALCVATLERAREAQRFEVLDACRQARADADVADALAWASQADVAFYRQEKAQREATP